MLQKPQAILFDLDGVLTDTSTYHYRAWKHLADDEGIPFTEEENDAHLRGVPRRESLMYIIRGRQYSEEQIQEMMDRKNRYYNDLIKQMTPSEVVAGGRELLEELRQAGIKTAIASASKNADIVLQRLEIINYFDGIADGNSVKNGKPAPDIFVYAAGLVKVPTSACLGVEDADAGIEAIKNGKPAPDIFVYAAGLVKVPTSACLGVEDADAGIEAIKNAGMQALAIGPTERFHRADKVLPTMENKRLQDLLD